MKGVISLLALPLLAAASPMLKSKSDQIAPLVSSETAVHIPDSYIIVLKDHVTQNLAAEHHDWVHGLHASSLKKRSQVPFVDTVFGGLKHTYNIAGSVLGYSGHFDQDVIEAIRRHPDVSMSISLSATH